MHPCITNLYVSYGLVQTHVDIPGKYVLGQVLHHLQLFIGLLLEELGVHLLPPVTLPLALLRVDDAHCLPHLL